MDREHLTAYYYRIAETLALNGSEIFSPLIRMKKFGE